MLLASLAERPRARSDAAMWEAIRSSRVEKRPPGIWTILNRSNNLAGSTQRWKRRADPNPDSFHGGFEICPSLPQPKSVRAKPRISVSAATPIPRHANVNAPKPGHATGRTERGGWRRYTHTKPKIAHGCRA